MKKYFVIMFFIIINLAFAQLKVITVEKLDLPKGYIYNAPKFSNDDKYVFFTNDEYNIIWRYSLEAKTLEKLIEAPKCGFDFDISLDGNSLTYRTTKFINDFRDRVQEIYKLDIQTKENLKIDESPELSTPKFVDNSVIYQNNYEVKNLEKTQSLSSISVLGIEFGKVVLNKYGEKVILDPYKNGSYIWPELNNKKDKILAYEADRGSFLMDLNGNILQNYGRLDAASFNYDDSWIIYMEDKDDGEKLISSDIIAINPINKEKINLTETKDIYEINPSCSKKGNKVTYNTTDGNIYVLSFEEMK